MNDLAIGIASNAIWALIAITPVLVWLAYNKIKGITLGAKFMRSGVVFYFPNRDSYARDRKLSLEEYLETAEKSLTYVGHWLAVSTDQRNTLNTLESMAKSGKVIQIVMLESNLSYDLLCAYARFFNRPPEIMRSDIKSSWDKIIEWHTTLGSREKGYVLLCSHSEFVSNSAFLFDENLNHQKILIDQKLWGQDRGNSYGIELHFEKKNEGKKSHDLFFRYRKSIINLRDISKKIT